MRIDWKTVGPVCERVSEDLEATRGGSRFDGLRRIGVDETSYKKGHKYLTVVVDHERNRVVWACKGHGKSQLNAFFDRLTEEQRAAVELGISNARIESMNNKIKLTIRMGYGFRNIDNLIALIMLRCSDLRPQLPGRTAA